MLSGAYAAASEPDVILPESYASFPVVFPSSDGGEVRMVRFSGDVLCLEDTDTVDFATVYLKDTGYGIQTSEAGKWTVEAPEGETIGEAVVSAAGGIGKLRKSAFNTVAVETASLTNTARNLGDALVKMPGMKLRESGGVGSDMQLMLDGFSGNHIKVFIDGVPQEGAGNSFSINNIPINYAERIEVYKGVVPVTFGTDAIGGVINIVTGRKPRRWFLDASYSCGIQYRPCAFLLFQQCPEHILQKKQVRP